MMVTMYCHVSTGKTTNMTLREALSYKTNDIYDTDRAYKHLDTEVVKEFSMSGEFWMSWQEFGHHKNVRNWYLLSTGYAVGFNENVSVGWGFPVIKLQKQMIERALNHTMNHDQYTNRT